MTTDDRTSSAMLSMQKELLDAYEQTSRVWLSRMKSGVELWSDLAMKLSATRSVPAALQAYQKYVALRMQITAEGGRQLFDEYQKTTRKITTLLSNAWTTRTT